jgi:hypothetical protein
MTMILGLPPGGTKPMLVSCCGGAMHPVSENSRIANTGATDITRLTMFPQSGSRIAQRF